MSKKNNFPSTYYNALFSACESGQIDVILRYLEKGLDINYKKKDNETALIIALKNNQNEAIKLLLDKGANLPEFFNVIYEKDALIETFFIEGENLKTFDFIYNQLPKHPAFKDEHLLKLIDNAIYFRKPELLISCLNKLKDSNTYLVKTLDNIECIYSDILKHNKYGSSDYYKQIANTFLDFLIENKISPNLENIYERLFILVSEPQKINAFLEKEHLENNVNFNKLNQSKKHKL